MPTALLEARQLAFGHGQHALGRDFNLVVQPGEIWCVLGPNGVGKTTLFRTLSGLQKRQAGEVLLQGAPTESLAERARASRVALVPQAAEPSFAFSVADVVAMGRIAMRGAFRAPSAVDRAACAHAIAAMGIAHLSTRAITDLSGGERQLAMIARALAQSAPLLIMDEPTASLDVANQALVLTAIARLASAGRAVLFCSHDPNHALDLADGVILLKAGQTVAEGKPHATLTPDRLEALYGTRFALARTAEGTMRCLPLIHPDTPQETR